MRLFVFTRHGESSFNVWHRVNGDPHRVVPLTARGERQARALGEQLRNVPIDLAVCTRFERTRRTAELALEGRAIPFHVEPAFDDIDVGRLDGQPIEAYREWKRGHTRNDRFPGGESLDAATDRLYVRSESSSRSPSASYLWLHTRYRFDTHSARPLGSLLRSARPSPCPMRRRISSTRRRFKWLPTASKRRRNRSGQPPNACRSRR